MKLLKPETLTRGLKTKSFGHSILCLEKVESTNDVVLRLAEEGAPEGTVVLAEVQTKGRGRQGRSWSSVPGKSLSFSILLRPRLKPDELSEITIAASVGGARTLEEFGFRPGIKWPNDLLLKDKKVCGILTELGPKKDKMVSVVLGVGINLNQGVGDFPKALEGGATSLLKVSGKKVDRTRFLRSLLFHLEETYGWVAQRRFSKVLQEWRKRSVTLGRQVKVTQGRRVFYGQAVDLDEKGALLIRTDHGMVERLSSGDVENLRNV